MSNISVSKDAYGVLTLFTTAGKTVGVAPVPCFPWRDVNVYISVRDGQGKELVLIHDLTSLDESSQQALKSSLLETSFMLNIKKVISIDTEFEIRSWRVETEQGDFQFQTRLDEWPQKINGHGLFIRDVAGNILSISDVNGMDEHSQRVLWPYMD